MMGKIEKIKLYREALAFYEIAECGRINIPEKKNVESFVPYIVNMSFATELFLKLLLIENGKSIDDVVKLSHHLAKLYGELTEIQKDTIQSSFKQPMVYSVAKELTRADSAFVRWRYAVMDKANGKIEASCPTYSFGEKPEALSGKQIKDTARGPNAFPVYFFKELNEVLSQMCASMLGITF